MREAGGDLSVEARADVDERIDPSTGEEPNLAHEVGREPGLELLREAQRVASAGIDGVERRSPDCPMMATADARWIAGLGIVREDDIRTPAADPLDGLAAQDMSLLDLAIRIPEEDHAR